MLMGIDIGTTGTKVVVYTHTGKVLGDGYSEYTVEHPHPNCAEQDPDIWLNAVKSAISQMVHGSKLDLNALQGLCISGQAPTLVPVNEKGNPVCPALIWLDNRAIAETQIINDRIGEKSIYDRFGLRLAPSFPFPKILWLKRHHPDAYSSVRWFHQAKDYVVSKLIDDHVTDVTHATGYFCFNVRTQKEEYSCFDAFDLDPKIVPAIRPCRTIIGETGPSAQTYGIPAGVPVVNGAVDSIMAIFGMGVFQPHIVCEVAGTSTVLANSTETALMDPTCRFLVNTHPLGKMWLSSAVMTTTGAVLKWFRDEVWKPAQTVSSKETNSYQLFDTWVAKSPPGAKGLLMLPYLQGERSPLWDPLAKGVLFGLTLQHNINDIVRAIYEASAIGNVHNIQELERLGFSAQEVRISGGPAQSEIWNQIKADAYGIPVLKPNIRYAENQGDAMLAGLSTNQIPFSQLKRWIRIEKTYEPDPKTTKVYRKLLKIYNDLYLHTKTLMASISELETP